jgi:hypothetical protein
MFKLLSKQCVTHKQLFIRRCTTFNVCIPTKQDHSCLFRLDELFRYPENLAIPLVESGRCNVCPYVIGLSAMILDENHKCEKYYECLNNWLNE